MWLVPPTFYLSKSNQDSSQIKDWGARVRGGGAFSAIHDSTYSTDTLNSDQNGPMYISHCILLLITTSNDFNCFF